jgi:hypothetical protein
MNERRSGVDGGFLLMRTSLSVRNLRTITNIVTRGSNRRFKFVTRSQRHSLTGYPMEMVLVLTAHTEVIHLAVVTHDARKCELGGATKPGDRARASVIQHRRQGELACFWNEP